MEKLQMEAGWWGRGISEQKGVDRVQSLSGVRTSSAEGGGRHGGEEG